MPKDEYSLVEFAKEIDRIEKMLKVKFRTQNLQPTVELAKMDSSGALHFPVDTSGDVPVANKGLSVYDQAGTAGSGEVVFINAFGDIIVEEILADFKAAAVVADRAVTLSIRRTLVVPALALNKEWTSQAVTASTGQYAVIWLPRGAGGGYYFVDDNGTLADSTVLNNPVPFYLRNTEGITINYTNPQVGDNGNIKIFYRTVA